MRPHLLFAALLLPLFASAQTDTLFFSRNWKKTKHRDSAAFFRIARDEGKLVAVKDYYMSTRSLQMTGHFDNLEQEYKQGWFVYYDSLGHKDDEGNFVNDKREGRWLSYYPHTDTIFYIGHLNNGAKDGIDTMLYANGQVKRTEQYRNDQFETGRCFDKNGKEIKYYPYQVEPEYPGGMQAAAAYLATVKYPKSARKNNVEGQVIVSFTIDTDGSVTDVKLVQSLTEDTDKEALRLIKAMPKWKPGKFDNEPVKYEYQQPITFRLED